MASDYSDLTPLQQAMVQAVTNSAHSDTTGIIDNDAHFVIDPITKKITNNSGKYKLAKNDHNSERLTFEMPRYIEGHDMTNCNMITISYLDNIKDGLYEVDDLTVNSKQDQVNFTWLISSNATQELGKIHFAIAFKCVQDDGTITYEWHTAINDDLEVIDTIDNGSTVVYINVDILEQWKQQLFGTGNPAANDIKQLNKKIENLESRVNDLESGSSGESNSPYKNKIGVGFGDSIVAGWGWKEGTGVIQPLKEKYTDATWINKAESGANMAVTSSPAHTPIVTQIKSYTGTLDFIIFDGGVNDVNNNISVGNISTGYDDSFDETTFCGAMESAIQYLMTNYPEAVKLFLIPHSFAKDNSYVDGIYEKAIEICEKWEVPYLDMRKYLQIAMTAKNKAKYTRNPNTGEGDGVHITEHVYRTRYSPIIDETLRFLGVGSISASETPETVAVTGVKLDQMTLTLDVGDSVQLTATVSPTNATNKSVTWSSNNSNVSVSGGKVTAKTAGSAVVTVTTADGGYTAQCNIMINASATVDHTELTSLNLDGNCYFDTEILPDQNTNIKAKWNLQSGPYIAGARDDNYKYGYSFTDNIYAVRGTVNSAAKSVVFWADDWVINQTGADFQATSGTNSYTVTNDAIDSFTLTSPYYLGNMSKNGAPAGAGVKGKIYYAQIYSGNTLVADMIPVKKSDGTLCLYDKVRKKYIYNAGTGTLTKG